MEFQDAQAEVRERLGEVTATFDTEGDFWTNDEIRRAINEAQRRFAAEEAWPFLVTEWTSTLAADDNELALPSNVSLQRVFNIAVDGDNLDVPRMLDRVDPREGFRLRHQYTNYTGIPRWYYIHRTDLLADEAPPIAYTAKVIPTPDAAYDVEALYYANPVLLTSGTDEMMIPEEYTEAIVAWATGKLFLKEHAISQKASEQFQVYYQVLAQAQKDLKAHNNTDEIVAWGRSEPLRGYWSQEYDPRLRLPPTLG